VAEVLVPDVPELPVLRLVVLHSSAIENKMDEESAESFRFWCEF
jgi:hypothetical protein